MKRVKVIATFYHKDKSNKVHSFKEGEIVPKNLKYSNQKVDVHITNRYFEKISGEKVIVYRCYYKERSFYYKLYFFSNQLIWMLEFEED